MAVFRVEKNQNYMAMSNHYLRNTDLSLKSKVLLSQMLSLPEEWDYTLKGLSKINREDEPQTHVFVLRSSARYAIARVCHFQGQKWSHDGSIFTVIMQIFQCLCGL